MTKRELTPAERVLGICRRYPNLGPAEVARRADVTRQWAHFVMKAHGIPTRPMPTGKARQQRIAHLQARLAEVEARKRRLRQELAQLST